LKNNFKTAVNLVDFDKAVSLLEEIQKENEPWPMPWQKLLMDINSKFCKNCLKEKRNNGIQPAS
jgi:hypothetical protein